MSLFVFFFSVCLAQCVGAAVFRQWSERCPHHPHQGSGCVSYTKSFLSITNCFGTGVQLYIKCHFFAVFVFVLVNQIMCSSLLILSHSVIQNIADSRPKVRYLIAKDDSNNTLEEIVRVSSRFMESF